jgi:hypothetical protein
MSKAIPLLPLYAIVSWQGQLYLLRVINIIQESSVNIYINIFLCEIFPKGLKPWFPLATIMCVWEHYSKYWCLLKRAVNITVFLVYEITAVFLIRTLTDRKHTANSVQVYQFVAAYNQLQLISILINNMMKSLITCGTSYDSSPERWKICAKSSVWYHVISKNRIVMLSVMLVTNSEYIIHFKVHYQIESGVCDICWYASLYKYDSVTNWGILLTHICFCENS